MTRHEDRYFGAATQTEWRQAFKDPAHFRFVVVIADEKDENFRFIEYTPAEFFVTLDRRKGWYRALKAALGRGPGDEIAGWSFPYHGGIYQ